ncbi:hypothetical protein ACH5RR_018083 [Cinchona calisaya]|uniref:Uncharacterized protein n=1 Tax=Cinchona calisaya TaxID=153742 RepID=A0ABD2ZLC1_9GENT
MVSTMSLAWAFERKLQSIDKKRHGYNGATSRQNSNVELGEQGYRLVFFKRLNRVEIVERRAKRLCYNCDEAYTSNHKCKCFFWLEKTDTEHDEVADSIVTALESELSLHSIIDV